jgi:hypothetical protein
MKNRRKRQQQYNMVKKTKCNWVKKYSKEYSQGVNFGFTPEGKTAVFFSKVEENGFRTK